jgi:hypothetical protein
VQAAIVGTGVFVAGPPPRKGDTIRVKGALDEAARFIVATVEVEDTKAAQGWRIWWVRTHFDLTTSNGELLAYGVASFSLGFEAKRGVPTPLVWISTPTAFLDFYRDPARARHTIETWGVPRQQRCVPAVTRFLNETSPKECILIGGAPFMPRDGNPGIVGGWWGLFPEIIYRRSGEALAAVVDCRN